MTVRARPSVGSALTREPTSQLELGAERYRFGISTTTAWSPARTRCAHSAQKSADPNAPSLRAEMVTGARSQEAHRGQSGPAPR